MKFGKPESKTPQLNSQHAAPEDSYSNIQIWPQHACVKERVALAKNQE